MEVTCNMTEHATQATAVLNAGGAGVSYDFSDAVVLVTGAARGMGRDIARRFAGYGAAVVASDVAGHVDALGYETAQSPDLEETVAGICDAGAEAFALAADVRDEEQVAALVDAAVERFGRLDVLVNNAGVFTGAPVTELTEQAWDAAIDTNLKGPFLCSKYAARHMKSRDGGGRITTVSSTSALVGNPDQAPYQSSKHGGVVHTRRQALDVAQFVGTLKTLARTGVYTPMLDSLMGMGQAYFQEVSRLCGASTVFPGLEALDVRDVSEAVLWLASLAARYVTGIALPVDGGFTCK